MTGVRSFGREAGVYLTGFAVVGAIQFVALPVYARVLGTAGYGLYTLTLAVTTAVTGVMLLGGDTALARFWRHNASIPDARTLAASWINLLTAWSLAVVMIAVLFAPTLWAALQPGSGDSAVLVIGLLALVPAQLSRMLAQILRNTFQPTRFAVSAAVIAALDVVCSLLLGVGLDLGLLGIFGGIAIGESLGSLLRGAMVRPYLGWVLHLSAVRPLLRFGVPVVPASLATWAMQSVDRLVLAPLVSPQELGVYGMAVSLVGPFTIITLSLGQAWMPRVVAIHAEDSAAARSMTASAVGYSLAGLGAAAVLVGAAAPLLLRIVGGPDYVEGAEALPLLALGAAFGGTGLFTATGLQISKRTGTFSAITVAAALLNVGLLWTLAPKWGLTGAAGAVAASYFVFMAATARLGGRAYLLRLRWARLGAMSAVLFAAALLCAIRPSTAAVLAGTAVCLCLLAVLLPQRPWLRG